MPLELSTKRLVLRPFRPLDMDAFFEMNADEEVMRYFPRPLGRAESDALFLRLEAPRNDTGFGYWVVADAKLPGELLGVVGLCTTEGFPFSPLPELAYRLKTTAWGQGFATEAARRLLGHAADLGLDELVAFTVPNNSRSRAVMERLGMWRDEHGDFDHPKIPSGHTLRRHVLYRYRVERS